MVEVGAPACIRITATAAPSRCLWAGLAEYMLKNGYDYLIGCASISMTDGGHAAASIYRQASARHLGPIEWRVFRAACCCWRRWNSKTWKAALPPLMGAICVSAPAFVANRPGTRISTPPTCCHLLPLARMNPRYMKHFIGAVAA